MRKEESSGEIRREKDIGQCINIFALENEELDKEMKNLVTVNHTKFLGVSDALVKVHPSLTLLQSNLTIPSSFHRSIKE